MKHYRLLLFVLLVSGSVTAQTRFTGKDVQQMKWLSGSWKGISANKPFYEGWRLVKDSILVNFQIEIQNGDTIIKESSAFLPGPNGVYYGRKPVEWQLFRLTENEIVLKNDTLAYSNVIIWLHTMDDHWLAILENPKSTIYYDLIRQPLIDKKLDEWIERNKKR